MHVDIKFDSNEKVLVVLSIILILFFSLIYYIENRTPQIINYPTTRTEIVAFGDSLVAGIGDSEQGGFVKDLELILNKKIVNLGVSGNTSADGLARINQVLDRNPALVIISLGGNDFIRRVPEEQVKKNLDKIISKTQNDGAMVMVLGVPGYGDLYKETARNHKAAYVSNILKGLITKDKYMSDPIHPNDLGYMIIAERVAVEIEKFLD